MLSGWNEFRMDVSCGQVQEDNWAEQWEDVSEECRTAG